MESSIFKPSSMDLIRAGLQDLDKARALFDQLKADDIPDERCAELLSALAHACDPDMALSNFVDIVNAMQSSQRDLEHVIPDNDALKRLVTVLGVSDAMGKFMRFKPQLVEAAAVDNCNSHLFNHAQRRARLLKAVGADPDEPAMPVASKDLAEAATALRSSYRNQLAAIIAQDAVADDPTSIQPTISRELSDLADAALEGALAIARHETEGSEHVRFTIIGMGKLGAQELNYVSDVDLIYVVEPADKDVDHQTLIRVGTKMGTMLQRHHGRGRAAAVADRRRPAPGRQGRRAGARALLAQELLRAVGRELGVPSAAQGPPGGRRPRPRSGLHGHDPAVRVERIQAQELRLRLPENAQARGGFDSRAPEGPRD